jgi:putative peptide zinc metalloprotease protein
MLHPGPGQPDGQKSWTLHDPASNRFFRIGWLEFEALKRFPLVKTARELCALLSRETVLQVEEEEIAGLSHFLVQNDLVIQPFPTSTRRFSELKRQRRHSPLKQLLHTYLFFTIPLLRPQSVLKTLYRPLAPLFTQGFFLSMMALLAFGLLLTAQRWDEFFTTARASFSLEGLVAGGIALVGVKVVHEFAHALMATKYGVRVASMGMAFMVLYPVLYTEASGAWKIAAKKQRLLIGAAGMMAELCLAAVALLIWHAAPDGGLKSAAFFVGAVSLAGTLAVNLNPLMRFDGYFLLSDALGMDNLQARGYALARWALRRALFGWNDPPPEDLPTRLARTVLLYSYASWIYRFLLFSGIAFMVYHLFFQPLGFFLMAVELGWFIALPILSELRAWGLGRGKIRWNKQGRRTALIAGGLLLFVLVPWRSSVDVPAIVTAAEYKALYAPAPAQILEIKVTDGEVVKAGAPLLILQSPELEHKLALARAALNSVELRYKSEQTSPSLITRTKIIEQQVVEARARLEGLEVQAGQLTLTAEFDGTVRDLFPALRPGQWVGQKTPLLRLVGTGPALLYGYVEETDLARISAGVEGMFYADTASIAPFRVRLARVQQTNAPLIEWPALAGPYGGMIDVRPAPSNAPGRLVPQQSLYAATLTPSEPRSYNHEIQGYAVLNGTRESLAGRLLRSFAALLIHESGL